MTKFKIAQFTIVLFICAIRLGHCQIVTQNWLQVSKDNWPTQDSNHEANQFHVLHQEQSGTRQFVRFNKQFWANKTLVAKPELSFRYWTTSDLALFRARNDNRQLKPRDIHLNRTREWTSGQIGQITDKEWADFQILSGDPEYTIAFKDVQLTYMEKLETNKLMPSPIHSYKNQSSSSPNLSNIERISTSTRIFQFQNKHTQIFLQNQINFSQNYPKTILQFQLVTLPSLKSQTIDFQFTKNVCTAKINNQTIKGSFLTFDCGIVTIDSDTRQLKSFNVTLSPSNKETGFVIINPLSISGSSTNLVSNSFKIPVTSQNGQFFKYNSNSTIKTPPYLNLIDSQPDNHDSCYTLTISQLHPQIQIYLTFQNQKQGIKLIETTENVAKFCLNDYVALRNIRNYQLTILFPDPKETFEFVLQNSINKASFQVHTPKESKSDETQDEITHSWYYYNERLLDYQINGADKPEVNFWACDMVANCFAYQKYHQTSTRGMFYSIPEEYKQILAVSPFVRIKTDKLTMENFRFSYARSNQNLDNLRKDLQSLNFSFKSTNFIGSSNPITFTDTINKTQNYTLKVPITHIDLRIRRLIISIHKASRNTSPKDSFQLQKLTFRYEAIDHPLDLTEIFQIKSSNAGIVISTEELFHVEPFQTKYRSGILIMNGYFTIVLAVQPEKLSTRLEFKLKLEDGALDPQTQDINYLVLPLRLPTAPNTQYPMLSKDNPKAMITTGLVHAGFEHNVPPHEIRLSFGSLTKNPLKSNDLTIKQIILSQGFPTIKPKQLQFTNSSVIFEDKSKEDLVDPNGNSFELMYIVELINKEQKVWINVEKFQMDDPKLGPKSTEAGPLIATLDPKYDRFVCPPNFKESDDFKSCTLEHFYRETTATCSNTCSNIFDHPLPFSSRYFNPSHPNPIQYLPYFTPSSVLPNLPLSNYLAVTKPQNPQDFCVDFLLQSSNHDHLSIYVDNSTRDNFNLDFSNERKTNPTKGTICASQLTNDVTKVNAIYFQFNPLKPIVNLYENYVEIVKSYQPPGQVSNTLGEGLFLGQLREDQFIDNSNGAFKVIPKEQIIQFKIINLTSIKGLKESSGRVFKKSLRTKWIKFPSVNRNQLRFTFKSNNSIENFHQIYLTISAPNQVQILQKPLSQLNQTSVNILDFKSNSDFYQLSIEIQIDLDKIKDETELSLALSHFSVNDPCLIGSTGELQYCNHHGACHRLYEQFSSNCQCEPGFSVQDQCGSQDYCTAVSGETNEPNRKVCDNQKLKCLNKLDLATFECDCSGDNKTRWDYVTQSCELKLIEPCGANQTRVKVGSASPRCTCLEGYFEINKIEGCIKYDPCNLQHRKLNRILVPKDQLCADSNAKCSPKNSVTDYDCICQSGFYNEKGTTSQNTKCLPDQCKGCEQTCGLKKDSKDEYECKCNRNYKLESGKCIVDESKIKSDQISKCTPINSTNQDYLLPYIAEDGKTCKCPNWFTFNNQAKSCNTTKFSCKDVEIKSDKQPGCACGMIGLKFDAITRKCTQECTDEFVQKCQLRNARCKVENDQAKCICNQGEIALATNSSNPEEWRCTPKCALLDTTELLDKKCLRQFEKCDSASMVFEKLDKDDSFLLGISKIANVQYCQCEVGFELKDGRCQLSSIPIRIIKDMQFDLKVQDENDKKMVVDKISTAFTSLISTLFHSPIHEIKCEPKPNSKVSCDITFQSLLNRDQIQTQLLQSCQWIGSSGDTRKCSFMTRDIQSNSKKGKRSVWIEEQLEEEMEVLDQLDKYSNVLVSDEQAVKDLMVQTKDFCANRDHCRTNFANSICQAKTVGNETLFECACDPAMFDIKTSTPMTFNSHTLHMNSCKLKDLCTEKSDLYGCTDPSAKCNLYVDHQNGNYIAQSYCSCPKSGRILSIRTASCTSSCDGYCMNGECAQDVHNPTKIVCHCADGFTGERCDKQLNIRTTDTGDSETSNKSFKIATIVLGAVLGLVLVGVLGVVILKRFTSFNFVLNFNRNAPEPTNQQQQPQHEEIPMQRRNVENE